MKDLLTRYRILRYWMFRMAGFSFVVIGTILTIYALDLIVIQGDRSDDQWKGLLMSSGGVAIGLFIVWFRPFKPKGMVSAIQSKRDEMIWMKWASLFFCLLSFLACWPGLDLHSVEWPLGLFSTAPKATGWLDRVYYFVITVLLGIAFFGILKRLAFTWKYCWILMFLFFFNKVIFSLSFALQSSSPDRWVRLMVNVLSVSIICSAWGLWWHRQIQYFVVDKKCKGAGPT